MANPTHRKRVAGWLNDLSTMVIAANQTTAELRPRIASATLLLADDFPDAATFSGASLRSVAAQFTFFPGYNQINDALAAWWAIHRPDPVRLMPPDIAALPMAYEDKLWIKFWRIRVLESFHNSSAATVLGMIRERHPVAYDWLVANDGDAEGVARSRGWAMAAVLEASMARAKADWTNPDKVRASVSKIGMDHPQRADMLRLLRALVMKHAPENLVLIPPDPPSRRKPPPQTLAEQVRALGVSSTPARKPGELTPEQLAAVRKAAARKLEAGWRAPWEPEDGGWV